MSKEKNIKKPEEETDCHICEEKKADFIIFGDHYKTCGVCGNEIAMCLKCFVQLGRDSLRL